MMKATGINKDKAIQWAEAVVANGATNIFDAVERAFSVAGRGSFDPHYAVAADTIFLLSDGQTNRGRIIETGPFLEEIRRINRLRKIAIHTIGLGRAINVGLMRGLAAQNNGKFVRKLE